MERPDAKLHRRACVIGGLVGGWTVRYRVNNPQVIHEMIDGEAIMINLVTGSYYSLDPVAAEVWTFVEASESVERIVTELDRRYDAEPGAIRRGVDDLIQRLASEGLVVPCSGDGAAESVMSEPAPATRQPFRPPQLEKFTDMQDLILLDPVHEVDSRGWPHLPNGQGATPQ
jgi:Coenzyme PQQ synthesis protein D (PqqD)